MLTTKEAAQRLGVSPRRVLQFIADGRLTGKKFGRVNGVNEASVKRLQGIERKVGRPIVKTTPPATGTL